MSDWEEPALLDIDGRLGGMTLSIPLNDDVEGGMTGKCGLRPGDLGGADILGDLCGDSKLGDFGGADILGDLDGVGMLN